MSHRGYPSFPPSGKWDRRLREVACHALAPVRLLHRNDWFAVRDRGGYFTIEFHEPQIVVLPVVDRRAVVMIRARRPVIGDTTLELPAGAGEAGETPEQGGARELAEETGIMIDPGRLVPMPPLAASPNRIPTLLYVFRVDLSQDEFDRRGVHDEEVEGVDLVPFEETVRRIAAGEIYVALPVAVICSYLVTRDSRTSEIREGQAG